LIIASDLVGWVTRQRESIEYRARPTGALPTRTARRVGKIARRRAVMITVPGNFAPPYCFLPYFLANWSSSLLWKKSMHFIKVSCSPEML
jgi:hypothetical protein